MRLLALDCETTGLRPLSEQRIVEFTLALDGGWGLEPKVWTERVDPGRPIEPQATEVHGIRDEDVEGLKPFRRHAHKVQAWIEEADLLMGFNLRSFDTLLLDQELRRAGEPGLPRDEHGRLEVEEIDLFRLWQLFEPRSLEGAFRRFLGRELEEAHSSEADALGLFELLDAMAAKLAFPEAESQEAALAELASLSQPEGEVDRAGRFRRREDGTVEFAFGKHEGEPVSSEPGYLEWMLGKDFPEETLGWARSFLDALASESGAA